MAQVPDTRDTWFPVLDAFGIGWEEESKVKQISITDWAQKILRQLTTADRIASYANKEKLNVDHELRLRPRQGWLESPSLFSVQAGFHFGRGSNRTFKDACNSPGQTFCWTVIYACALYMDPVMTLGSTAISTLVVGQYNFVDHAVAKVNSKVDNNEEAQDAWLIQSFVRKAHDGAKHIRDGASGNPMVLATFTLAMVMLTAMPTTRAIVPLTMGTSIFTGFAASHYVSQEF